MKKRTVRKGNFYCDFEFPRLMIKPTEISMFIHFTPDLYYCPCKLPVEDREDINKLFGVTWAFDPRLYSARFGFVNTDTDNQLKLYSFIHQEDRDKWDSHYLTTIDLNDRAKLLLSIIPNYEKNSIAFFIDGRRYFTTHFDFSQAFWLARELKLYHGGNNPAPKTISYEFERFKRGYNDTEYQAKSLVNGMA